MKNILSVVLILLGSQISSAALAPFFNSVREIKAILDNEQVYQQLGSRSITSITREKNVYSVATDGCALNVAVTYVSPPYPGFAGPGELELHVGTVTCLPR